MQISLALTSLFALAVSASASLHIRDVYLSGYEAGMLAAREAAMEDYDDEFSFSARDLDDMEELIARGITDKFAINTAKTVYDMATSASQQYQGAQSARIHNSMPRYGATQGYQGSSSSSHSSQPAYHAPSFQQSSSHSSSQGRDSVLNHLPAQGSIASLAKFGRH